jgi:predicted MFS family arabinose efflux permease
MIATIVIAREPKKSDPNSHPVKSLLDDLVAGIKFIFTHETLAFVILAMSAAMFAISCFGPLVAVYTRDDLHANSTQFGLINSLIGVGMICGSMGMSRLGSENNEGAFDRAGLVDDGRVRAGAGGGA